MTETVLLNSGDIFFRESRGGDNTLLPSNKKVWLNEQILDMYQSILDLQNAPGVAGKDGKNVELKVGIFPEGSPDLPENYAVCWRWSDQTVPDTWKPLVWYKDLKGQDGEEGPAGPIGPEGPIGPQGTGVVFKGSVVHSSELVHLSGAVVGDGYIETSTGHLWVLLSADWATMGSWHNMGKISGPTGPRGPTGARGPKGADGKEGAAGSISMFVIQWMVNSATSAAISGAMNEVSSMINDAINDAINQLMTQMEDMVKDTVEKTLEDMMDEFKGEKGDKGDDGEKGKDGTSFKLVGRFDTVAIFQTQFPPSEDTVGFAAMIGPENSTELEMWAVTQSTSIPGIPPVYRVQKYGKLQGPKGADAEWKVSIRDKDFVPKGDDLEVVSDLPSGVAGMYVQETDSILVEGIKGSAADAKQVGFRMSMKYPIPKLVKQGDHGVPTSGKVLGNDGEKLAWVDGGSGGGNAEEEILLKGADSRVWSLHIDDNGNLHQDLSINNTDKEVLQLKSPNGQKWGITINNIGKLNVSEVY